MYKSVLQKLWIGALALLIGSTTLAFSIAQQSLAPAGSHRVLDASKEASDVARSPIRLARRGGGLAQAYYIGKNHELVRYAFREVIESANRATVRVLSDGQFVSLGTVVGRNGWVVTKASELSGDLYCRIPNKGSLKASVHTTDEQTDLALLKVAATDLEVAKLESEWLANHSELKAGSLVAVPGGYAPDPLAIGIVSTSKLRTVVRDRGIVGIELAPTARGVLVISVIPGSAAERSGLKTKDIVLELNSVAVENPDDLIQRVKQLRPGAILALVLQRGDRIWTEKIELGRFSDLQGTELAEQNRLGGALSNRRSGFPEVLQHDSLVRANQCGGPLVNLDGETIGINIARAGRVETFALSAKSVGEALQRMMPKTELTSEKSAL
jgi:serine protease Do